MARFRYFSQLYWGNKRELSILISEHYTERPLPGQEEGQRVFAKFDNENLRKDTGIVKGFDPEQRTCIIETWKRTSQWRTREKCVFYTYQCVPKFQFDLDDSSLNDLNIGPSMAIWETWLCQASEQIQKNDCETCSLSGLCFLERLKTLQRVFFRA